MTNSLPAQIQNDLKSAMKSGDKRRVAALRLVTAALKQVEVDQRVSLDESLTINVLEKLGKQRRESIEKYAQAGRDDLRAQEEYELGLLEQYLPSLLDKPSTDAMVAAAITAVDARGVQDMGKVMGHLKASGARLDMKYASAQVRAQLSD